MITEERLAPVASHDPQRHPDRPVISADKPRSICTNLQLLFDSIPIQPVIAVSGEPKTQFEAATDLEQCPRR